MGKEKKIKFRYFKISVSFLFFRFYGNSKVISISNQFTLVLWATWYSLITIMFGWWGGSFKKPFQSIKNSLEALHINLSGGIDFTNEIIESEYSDKLNFIWRNLSKITIEKFNRDDIQMITELQEEYEYKASKLYDDENITFLKEKLKQVKINEISDNEILDIFDAIKSYHKFS